MISTNYNMKKCFLLLSVMLLGYQASVGNNNHKFSDEDLPINYVTISSNGVEVAQVIVPIEKYGECEIIWTIMNGLTCEGQVISSNVFAIATFVNGVWQQNKHENWVSPTTDSGGWDISGTGECGSTQYNFRYSIGIPTPDYNGGGGVMQNGTYKSRGFISRKDKDRKSVV